MKPSPFQPTGRRTLVTAGVCAVLALSGSRAAADALREEAPVPGGTVALSRALGLESVPDRGRFVTELAQVLFAAPAGANSLADARVQKLLRHLEAVTQLQAALAALPGGGDGIELARARDKTERDRLTRVLDLVGLKLRERGATFAVDPVDRPAPERVRLLTDLGIDPGHLAARLNGGEAVHVDVPADTVPIPLPVRAWSDAIFRRPLDLGTLFAAVVSDRRAALLCHGLAALDDETLRFLAERPPLLVELLEHDAGAFAAFAGSLRVRGHAVVVPGGDIARVLWEAALDEKAGRADRFVLQLFRARGGRAAYLYDALAQLDPPTRAFALGLWMNDADRRPARFKALLTSLESFPGWMVQEWPFVRPTDDTVTMLTRTTVDESGTPSGPPWKTFWSRVFDGTALPDDPARELKDLEKDGLIDAAWLSDAVVSADKRFRGERLDQMAFGQRVFGSPAIDTLPDMLVALRAFPRYRMLILTLERMGMRRPSVYAAAARQAQRLSTLDPGRAYVALSQFQGALALLARMTAASTLEEAAAEQLVTSLSAIPLNDEGRFAGSVARWMQQSLARLLGEGGPEIDAALVSALSGPQEAGGPTRPVSWEGRLYRVDLGAAERHRMSEVLRKLQADPLGRALHIEIVAETLVAPDLTLAGVQSATRDLDELSAQFASSKKARKADFAPPPGVERGSDRRAVLVQAVHALAALARPHDLKKADKIAEPVLRLVDGLLAEALVAYVYALSLGDPEGSILLAGNVSRRHDFGFLENDHEIRLRAPWSEPVQSVQPGAPWKVTGSLLGLDLGLSDLALRRVSVDPPDAPILNANERATFAKTVALLNPIDMADADRDEIAEAIDRGRQRVDGLTQGGEGIAELAGEISMDGWRRESIRWSLMHDPGRVLSWFSLTDLLHLGHPSAVRHLGAWGMAADTLNGCTCTRVPPPGRWTVLTGRARVGVLATQIADLNLRIALALKELELPAALGKGVLAAATLDFVDEVKPLHLDDWLTLVRAAEAMPTDRIEDYVAGLTVNGPLVPAAVDNASEPRP